MAAAQSARDLANSEARKSTVRLGKSLSEGQLQKAVGWQALKAERHEELMRQKHALRVQALSAAREKKRQMLNAYHARQAQEAEVRAEKYHHAMQLAKDKQDAFEAERQEAERL